MVEAAMHLNQACLEEDEEREAEQTSKQTRKREAQALVPPGALSSSDAQPDDEEQADATYTVNEAIDHMGFGAFQLALLFYAGLAWAADAMEMMLLSFLGPAVRCDWGLSATQESLITSVVFLGTMLGANTWGALSDARGRRVGFQACAGFIFVFGLASAAAPNYLWLLVIRFLVGIGLGGVPVAFALFAEFCPTTGRGGWLIALQAFWTFGSMAEAAIAWAVLIRYGWRLLLALSAAPFVLLMALYPLLPESPHFLAVSGRLLEAQDVLHRISHWNGRPLPAGQLAADSKPMASDAEKPADEEEGGAAALKLAETADISAANSNASPHAASSSLNDQHRSGSGGAEESESGGTRLTLRLQSFGASAADALRPASLWRRLVGGVAEVQSMLRQLLSPALRRTTLLLLFIWFANAISYYGLVLLATTLHVSDSHTACTANRRPNLSSAAFSKIFLTSTAELPGMLLAAVVVELFTRKRTLAAGLLITSVCTAALMATPAQVFLWGSRAGAMGAFAVLFIYTPEVYPTTVRSLGMGVVNSFSRIGGLLSPFLAVALVQAGYTRTAEACFALFCLTAAVAVMALPIETKDRALQAAPEEAPAIAMVPQLERESPQHSSVYQQAAFRSGFSGGAGPFGDADANGVHPAGFTISQRSDSCNGSAFSLGSVSEDGGAAAVEAEQAAAGDSDERPRAALLLPGAIRSDGPLAEDR